MMVDNSKYTPNNTYHANTDYFKESVDLTKIHPDKDDSLLDDESSRSSEYEYIDRILMGDQRNRTLFDWAPEAIVIVNKEGVFLDANARLFEWLGYKPEEVIGKTIFDLPFFPPETKSIIRQKFYNRLKGVGDPSYSVEFIHKNGSHRWGKINATILRDESTGVVLDLIMVSDITEQKKAVEDLQESEEKYRSIFEYANDLIQSVDAQGRFIEVNPKWLKTLGHSKEDIMQLTLQDILHPDQIEHCMQLFQKVCLGESIDKVRTVFLSKDGRQIPVEGSASAITKNKKFISTIGIFRELDTP